MEKVINFKSPKTIIYDNESISLVVFFFFVYFKLNKENEQNEENKFIERKEGVVNSYLRKLMTKQAKQTVINLLKVVIF